MTRLPTFILGAITGTTIAGYTIRRTLKSSIRDGTLLRALTAQAARVQAAADARAAAAQAPDEVEFWDVTP